MRAPEFCLGRLRGVWTWKSEFCPIVGSRGAPYNGEALERDPGATEYGREVSRLLYAPKERGQGLVEYALILVLVAVVVIVILALLGPAIGNVFSNIVSNI